MRIAVWHNLPSGGGKRALFNHVKALKEKGHYLESWTTDFASQNYLPLSEIITEHCFPIKEQIIKISNIKSSIRRTLKSISVLKNLGLTCAKEIEKNGFDLILANSCCLSYMPYIGLYAKIPVIVYLGEPNRRLYEANTQGNIWALPSFKFSLRGINRIRKDLVRIYLLRLQISEEIKAARSNRRILVNSLYSRESIKKAYGLDSEVCYLGLDEKAFPDANVVKHNYVVGLGRISEAKNVEMAIKVISRIPSESRPQLKWISNGFAPEYFEEMMTLSRELDVDLVPLIDISDESLKKVLGEAAVMIYTSHLEPFGLAPLEANACCTCVVAIAEGGIRESVQHNVNGILVNGCHIDEMAGLILKFVSDLNYAKQMGLQSQEYVLKNWSSKKMAENIENALMASVE